jgi:hypothetical protein
MARLKGTILVRYEPSLIFYFSGTVQPGIQGVWELSGYWKGVAAFLPFRKAAIRILLAYIGYW